MSVSPGAAVAGAALPRPVPPPPRLTCVEENTVRQIKSKLIQLNGCPLAYVFLLASPSTAFQQTMKPKSALSFAMEQSRSVVISRHLTPPAQPRIQHSIAL